MINAIIGSAGVAFTLAILLTPFYPRLNNLTVKTIVIIAAVGPGIRYGGIMPGIICGFAAIITWELYFFILRLIQKRRERP